MPYLVQRDFVLSYPLIAHKYGNDFIKIGTFSE